MCTHQAQNRFKILNPHILAILRAKCTQEKNDIFFWILWDLSFPTHIRLLKSDKNSLLCAYLNFVREPPNMTPLMKFFFWSKGQKKNFLPNFKISHRSEFFTDFDHRKCVGKLRSRKIQKNKSHFSCVHFARRMTKIWGLTILTLVCAWWVHVK